MFEQKMLELSAKVSSQKHLSAVKYAFTALTPLIIVGAFSLLFKSVLTDPINGLAKFEQLSFLANYQVIFADIQYATYNILTIFIVFLIALELAKQNGYKGSYIPGIFALACYVAVIPNSLDFTPENAEAAINIPNVIARSYTDTSAIFLGMFVSLTATELFCYLSEIKWLQIKMPDSVPSNVAVAFSALFPMGIGMLIFSGGEFIFESIVNMTSYDAIFMMIQQPLSHVIQGAPGILLLMLISQIFWVFGIHGNQIIKPIREPLLLDAINQNMDAFNAGEAVPNIVTMPFWDIYGTVGGGGVSLGLIIAIYLFSRREDHREVAKLSAVPGIFNINETMIFGIPIVLNPIMAIPFVITPLITLSIGYFATAIGFAGKTVIMIPWTTPPILSAWLATAGNIGAVITQIICVIVAVLIYTPFVKYANKEVK